MLAVEAKQMEARARARGRNLYCVICNVDVDDFLDHVATERHRAAATIHDRQQNSDPHMYESWDKNPRADVH
jgi:hypothetical protein